jgi:hypothetical protein
MDASAEERATAGQVKGALMPIGKAAPTLEKVAITADMKVRLPACFCCALAFPCLCYLLLLQLRTLIGSSGVHECACIVNCM